MRSSCFAFLLVFVIAVVSATAQQSSTTTAQTPQRDTQAVALLQQAIATMATTVPTDSSATGTVTVVEGSTTQNGSIQILTLGTSQTAETLTLPDGQRQVIYSSGASKEINGNQSSDPPMELVLTDQSTDFPVPFLLSALSNSDESIHYVGVETLNGQSVQHIQLWDSFASTPPLQFLAPFSTKDIWFNSSSGLPTKLSYSRRVGGQGVPVFSVELYFSNYTNVNGVFYPFQINKSLNGTQWTTITISSVSFNTGLTISQFPVD
jgi:hypothetical protein